jgi:phosphate transport system substrate-binding protein
MQRAKKWMVGAATIATMVSVVGCGAANNSTGTSGSNGTTNSTQATSNQAVSLSETGSSLLYPLFQQQWISNYKTVDPKVTISAASTGSGAGISQATAGTVDIGASDAYMADAQLSQSPSMLNIPVAVSAQQVMYNLPGMKTTDHLNLSGDVLAQIYLGKVQYWDDPAIAATNKGVKLPHKLIVPVHRSDGSGDTFLFTQYLTDTSSAWKSGPAYGTTVSWPAVNGGIGSKGNSGVVASLASTPYSIGYVGISWLDKATAQGIGYAGLKNQAGSFVLPTSSNILSAVNAKTSSVPADERISLIDAPGASSYPIVNFEYTIVNSKQADASKAAALKKFLGWAIDPAQGNSAKFLTPVHFLPLPSSVKPLSEAQINKIGQ